MSDIGNVRRIEIESDLEALADKFSAEIADTAVWRAADDDERWTIEAGYIDAIEQAALVTQLRVGPVEQWKLRCTPEGMVTVVTGLDRSADLLHGQVRLRFLVGIRPAILQSVTGAEIEPVTSQTGTFTASQVAQRVCQEVGLAVMWNCRDYILREDFDAVGPAGSILTKLIEPWCLVEPTKVDLWVENDLVIIQARELNPVAPPSRTYTVPQALAMEITLTRKRLPFFSRVVLTGVARRGGIVSSNVNPQEPFVPGPPFAGPSEVPFTTIQDILNEDGVIVVRIRTTITKRMPDDLTVAKAVQTYAPDLTGRGMRLVKSEISFEIWDTSVYDELGVPVNQPLLRTSGLDIESLRNPDDTALRLNFRERTRYIYNTADRFLIYKGTQKYRPEDVASLTNDTMVERERIVEYHEEQGPNRSLVTVDTYRFDENGNPFLKDHQTAEGAGLRAGGVRPPQPRKTQPTPGTPGTTETIESFGIAPVTLIADGLSEDERATELVYNNPHLDENDLRFLMARIVEANGLAEYGQTIPTTMLQHKKGQAIAITGLEDADGNEIPTYPGLIFGLVTRLDTDPPSLTAEVTTRSWRSS